MSSESLAFITTPSLLLIELLTAYTILENDAKDVDVITKSQVVANTNIIAIICTYASDKSDISLSNDGVMYLGTIKPATPKPNDAGIHILPFKFNGAEL